MWDAQWSHDSHLWSGGLGAPAYSLRRPFQKMGDFHPPRRCEPDADDDDDDRDSFISQMAAFMRVVRSTNSTSTYTVSASVSRPATSKRSRPATAPRKPTPVVSRLHVGGHGSGAREQPDVEGVVGRRPAEMCAAPHQRRTTAPDASRCVKAEGGMRVWLCRCVVMAEVAGL